VNADELKIAAAIAIVAWIVDDKPIPGIEEHHECSPLWKETDRDRPSDVVARLKKGNYIERLATTGWSETEKDRLCVTCDFLPASFKLSDDARVTLVTPEEGKSISDERGFRGVAYLHMHLESASENEVAISTGDTFDILLGHGYRFTFTASGDVFEAETALTRIS
jgi:hypothetical protein